MVGLVAQQDFIYPKLVTKINLKLRFLCFK